MGIFKTVFLIVGTSIGAGFLSGAELVRFFRTGSYFLPVLCSAAEYFALSALLLALGRRHGGYRGATDALFGRAAPAVRGALLLCAFVPCAGMLAGLDALAPHFSPLLSCAGLLFVCLALSRGMKGIAALNAALVPVLLAFVFFFTRGEKNFFLPTVPNGLGGFAGGAVYAGMNVFFAAPVFLEAGKDVCHVAASSLGAALVIALSALCILGIVFREDALDAELPFLYALHGERKLFSLAVALAILTSLASSLYPLLSACDRFPRGKKYAAKGFVLSAAFALSRFGLGGIVRIFYPIVGVLGLIFSALCVLDEYLFQKDHKKIHSRGEQAQNDGRAHHEVEFEHLPAVHDEIAEPRPRNDILSHDRADPRHSHVDFEHGNEGG